MPKAKPSFPLFNRIVVLVLSGGLLAVWVVSIKELAPRNQPGYASDHPMMGMVYLAGALAGIFVGTWLSRDNADDSALGLYLLAGAALGVAATYALVVLADRRLKVGLVQPIGFGVAGAGVGLVACQFMMPLVGWRAAPAVVAAGAVIGCAFGVLKQQRERSPSQDHPEKKHAMKRE